MDSCCVYNYINTGNDIRSFLSVEYLCTHLFKVICKGRFFIIGSGNSEAFF